MELLAVFGAVLRHRVLLALGVVLAVAITVLAAQRLSGAAGRADVRSVAFTRVLVDERRSLVADDRARGPLTIATRASILADLVADVPAQRDIAARAGVRAADLGVVSPAVGPPAVVGPLPDRASDAQKATVTAHPDLVQIDQEPTLPVLEIRAQAPDRPTAARLAAATTAALQALLDERRVGRRAGVVVRPLGAVHLSRVEVGGAGHPILAVIGGIFLLAAWCSGIVMASGLARLARRSARRTQEASAPAR